MASVNFAEIQVDGTPNPLQSVSEMSITDEISAEVMHTMRRSNAGFAYSVSGQAVSGSFTSVDVLPYEIDWDFWMHNGDERLVNYEEVATDGQDGPRYRLDRMRITSIDRSRAKGENSRTINWVALKHEVEG